MGYSFLFAQPMNKKADSQLACLFRNISETGFSMPLGLHHANAAFDPSECVVDSRRIIQE